MREILFRGKRIDNGEWVTGDLWNMPYADLGVSIVIFFIDTGTTGGLRVIPETIGQYTGLKDKNGKNIFEGDILDCGDRLVRVEWNGPNGCWDSVFIKYKGELCSNGIEPVEWKYRATVIGNIHDNPELMGE